MIHLAPRKGYALTMCGLTNVIPIELTHDLDERTCLDCRTAMINTGHCPVCGEPQLSWGVVDVTFYLACDHCSETIISVVSSQTLVEVLTAARWYGQPTEGWVP